MNNWVILSLHGGLRLIWCQSIFMNNCDHTIQIFLVNTIGINTCSKKSSFQQDDRETLVFGLVINSFQWSGSDGSLQLEMLYYGPFACYKKLRVVHAPGMLGTFSPPPRVSDPDMHHGTCVTHVPWYTAGSITSGLLWSRWREERSRHSRRMCNPQLYVSGRKPIDETCQTI